MSDQADYKVDAEDYSDLGFDVGRHREAFGAFETLDLHPESVRPTLNARNLILYEVTQGKFTIGDTADAGEQEKAERSQGAIAFKVLYRSANGENVERVRSDVEKYFRRHFPGRCLNGVDSKEGRTGVFLAVYPPTE